jgi:hypothetical protein
LRNARISQLDHQHVIGIHSEIRGIHPRDAAQKQSGADKQHHRQHRLHDRQPGSQRRPGLTVAIPAMEHLAHVATSYRNRRSTDTSTPVMTVNAAMVEYSDVEQRERPRSVGKERALHDGLYENDDDEG